MQTFFPYLLTLLCLALIVVHGLERKLKFKVDLSTILLLALSSVPFVSKYISEVQTGDIKIAFKYLPMEDQISLFIEGVTQNSRWTYYAPRNGETNLGQAFSILTQNMYENDRAHLISMVDNFLKTPNENLKWFACENIGYYKLEKFKNHLPALYKNLDRESDWSDWELNCFWAHSRFNDYSELHDFLLTGHNENNLLWILDVYAQMPLHKQADPDQFKSVLSRFLKRGDLDEKLRSRARQIIRLLENLPDRGKTRECALE